MAEEIKQESYQAFLQEKEKEWESLCRRCGACCGAYDDPCVHLKKNGDKTYYCEIYPDRLGLRKTVSGEEFRCVPVKRIIRTYWKNGHICPYKKILSGRWVEQSSNV
ncbi:MAG: hypothetical protein WCY34_03075 [Candidatus Omnitrophota bacterium]|jgi:uncharacterized cysteine cluster protein YcgN (CxxCxxCC family)